jgi:hypothetical protein
MQIWDKGLPVISYLTNRLRERISKLEISHLRISVLVHIAENISSRGREQHPGYRASRPQIEPSHVRSTIGSVWFSVQTRLPQIGIGKVAGENS